MGRVFFEFQQKFCSDLLQGMQSHVGHIVCTPSGGQKKPAVGLQSEREAYLVPTWYLLTAVSTATAQVTAFEHVGR